MHGTSAAFWLCCSYFAYTSALDRALYLPAALMVQVDVAIDEVDQIDLAANAAIMGTRVPPTGQQPQLPRTRAVLEAASSVVVMVDSCDVSVLHD